MKKSARKSVFSAFHRRSQLTRRRVSNDRYEALLARHEELKAKYHIDTTRLQERGDRHKNHANRLKQSHNQLLEASLSQREGIIQTIEQLRDEHERLLASYNLMLTERIEVRKRTLEVRHQLEEGPEGRQLLDTVNQILREREAQRECFLRWRDWKLNFVKNIMLRDLLIRM